MLKCYICNKLWNRQRLKMYKMVRALTPDIVSRCTVNNDINKD